MSQQYPHNPNQPYQGAPGYPQGPAPYQPPPPPKKGLSTGAIVGMVIGGVFVLLIVLGGIVGGGGDKADAGNSADRTAAEQDTNAKSADKPTQKSEEKKKDAPAKKRTSAEEFKAFVTKNGTPTEKAAVQHVTKVQGADKQNDILDSADVYTDFTGGFMSENQNSAKLIASAFADWKDSENGLVTVYGSDGDMITNGNF